MEKEILQRIGSLEQEVKTLKTELETLRNAQKIEPKRPISTIEKMREIPQEKPLTKIFFPDQVQKEEKSAITYDTDDKVLPEKPTRSLEETFLALLPKVFMVILVIGVLWGLKVASDNGIISNTVKVGLGYLLAVVLAVAATLLDKAKRAAQALIISLYGGAFIVGILTTAAAAILYEILPLNSALVIAFVFVAYGIGISYLKHNEVLTSFVAFTSLLLPFLLEYMEFNKFVIVGFVLVLMLALQIVIVKYQQMVALYIATFISIMALTVILDVNVAHYIWIYFGVVLTMAIFYGSWWKITSSFEKSLNWHVGILFSLNLVAIGALFIAGGWDVIPMSATITLFIIQALFAALYWKENRRDAFDIMASSAILTGLITLLTFDWDREIITYSTLITSFAGVIVALKLRISVMKISYSFLFSVISLFIYLSRSTIPIWSLKQLEMLSVIVGFIAITIYAKKERENPSRVEQFFKKIHLMDAVAIIIFLFSWWYFIKLDETYKIFTTSAYGFTYHTFTDIILGILIAVVIMLPKKWVGAWLPIFALFIFVMKSLLIFTSTNTYSSVFWEEALIRFVYATIAIAIFVDIWKEGLIYKKFESYLKQYMPNFILFAIIWLLFIVFGMTDFLHDAGKITRNIAVLCNTFSVFIAAIIAILIGSKTKYNIVKYGGNGLLVFGFIKMIFYDLSNLDLLLRSVLFIVIGGVGLLVSNKITKK